MTALPADPALALTSRGMELAVERLWPGAACTFGQSTLTGGQALGWFGRDHCVYCAAHTPAKVERLEEKKRRS